MSKFMILTKMHNGSSILDITSRSKQILKFFYISYVHRSLFSFISNKNVNENSTYKRLKIYSFLKKKFRKKERVS
jgi:hypothetical protein